jgi:Icc-related predicted phosphoesterase
MMRILALSDTVIPAVYSSQICDLHGDVDLVIGCGDLPYYYLEYVVTMLNAPVVYVFGNHDGVRYATAGRVVHAPQGCTSLEGRTLKIGNLILAGLGGSIRYRPGAHNQYTQGEMLMRVVRLVPRLLMNRLRYGRYLDILVTHSPPFGIHDGSDRAHIGFKSLLTLMRYFKPRYLLHGHKHIYARHVTHKTDYHETTVVNVYPRLVIDWDGSDDES